MKAVEFTKNLRIDASTTMYPSILTTHSSGSSSYDNHFSTYFGFCLGGKVQLQRFGGDKIPMSEGMYFSSIGKFEIQGDGQVFVIERIGYRGLFTLGGPVENDGRLCYIDNCKSTILIPPARLGDPVFNLLVFPPQTQQTMHIHPTIRLGAVFRGSGVCHSKGSDVKLAKNTVFHIGESEAHCFHTQEEGMSVIAYHPESDVGPTDTHHPMLSRTYTKF